MARYTDLHRDRRNSATSQLFNELRLNNLQLQSSLDRKKSEYDSTLRNIGEQLNVLYKSLAPIIEASAAGDSSGITLDQCDKIVGTLNLLRGELKNV
jgi:hypothetical protein